MTNLLLVGIGGFIGAVLRYSVSLQFPVEKEPLTALIGTASVNLVGCLIIGLFIGLIDIKGLFNQDLRLFLIVGLLGGLTTFSTFGAETFFLLEKSKYALAAIYVFGQILLGVLFVWLGYLASKLA